MSRIKDMKLVNIQTDFLYQHIHTQLNGKRVYTLVYKVKHQINFKDSEDLYSENIIVTISKYSTVKH